VRIRGCKPSHEFIDTTKDDIRTNFPYEKLSEIVTGFPEVSILSDDAGTYLCNYLYYKSLKRQAFKSCVLFVHVADVKNDEQAVDLAIQKQIVEKIVIEFSILT
jgi:pyrrolidone-carboxylate peptidase